MLTPSPTIEPVPHVAVSALNPKPRLAVPLMSPGTVELAVIVPFLFCQLQTVPGTAQIVSTTSNVGVLVPEIPVTESVIVTRSAASTSTGVTDPVVVPPEKLGPVKLAPSSLVGFAGVAAKLPP